VPPAGSSSSCGPTTSPGSRAAATPYRSFEGYIEREFPSLEEALEIGAIF